MSRGLGRRFFNHHHHYHHHQISSPIVVALCLFLITIIIDYTGASGSSGTSISRRCNSRWQEVVIRNKWGYIYSPNYGQGDYYAADTCYWLLTSSEPANRIRVIFQAFSLQERNEPLAKCVDYVSLYDGRRETAPSLGTFCGSMAPRTIISSGRHLLIKFYSDDELQYPGFRILYETMPTNSVQTEPKRGMTQESSQQGDSTATQRHQQSDGATLTSAQRPTEDDSFASTVASLQCPDGSQAVDLLRSIADQRLTASSSWRNHPPWLARLDNKATALAACCWAAENSADDSAYIQAEFDARKLILAVVTQGSDILDEWVTSYRLAYGLTGGDFTYYKTVDGKIKIFRANKNAQVKAASVLDPPITAKYVRLLPLTAHRWKTLRWGVYGCNESTSIPSRGHPGNFDSSDARYRQELRAAMPTAPPTADRHVGIGPEVGQVFAEERPIFSLDAAHTDPVERCNGAIKLMTEPRNRITSPNFGVGKHYPLGDTCTWQIFARDDQRIKVMFEILSIEESFGCQRDFVALYDGPTVGSPPLGKFCGYELPPILVTSGNQLTIFFNSGEEVDSTGFALTYFFMQEDGGSSARPPNQPPTRPTAPTTTMDPSMRCDDRIVIMTATSGKVESPGYGRKQYPPDDMCNWRLIVPNGMRVRVFFQDFDLAPATGPSDRCEDEYLAIYDGPTDSSRLLGSYCSSYLPQAAMSSGSAIFMRLRSGPARGYRAGFRAVYNAVEIPTTTTTMPTSPMRTAPATTWRPTPWRLTTTQRPNGNNNNNDDDDQDMYQEEPKCDGQMKIMTQSEGAITSPRFSSNTYYSQDICFWLLRAPAGYRIRYFFDTMSIEQAPRCSIDNLTLFDGDRDSAPLLGYFCGYDAPNESFLTSGQYLLVRFVTGNSNNVRRTGFRIYYRFVNATQTNPVAMNSFVTDYNSLGYVDGDTPYVLNRTTTSAPANNYGCRGVKNLLTGERGVVVSPNFGSGPYWPSDTCFWELRTLPSKRIRLGFQVFKVAWSPDCSRDRLIIYDGSSELSRVLGTYCGNSLPMPVTSTINVLLLKFVTDSRSKSADDVGFMALYGTVEYVSPLPTRPPPTASPKAPVAEKPDDRPMTVARAACNGSVAVLVEPSGYINSPDFAENMLPSGVMCFWEIRAPPELRVRLNFETFAMPETEDCIGAHVALFIGSGSARPQIGRFCGDELPPQTTSPGDRLFVRFVSGPYSVPGGFAARYNFINDDDPNKEPKSTTTTTPKPTTTIQRNPVTDRRGAGSSSSSSVKCDDRRAVLTDSKGSIRSPNFDSGGRYFRGDSCWWQILLQPGSVINMKFRSFNLVESRACTGDRLVLIDGPDARRSPTIAYCGHTLPPDFRSSSNIVTLHFYSTSDSAAGDLGFEVEYAELAENHQNNQSNQGAVATVLPSATVTVADNDDDDDDIGDERDDEDDGDEDFDDVDQFTQTTSRPTQAMATTTSAIWWSPGPTVATTTPVTFPTIQTMTLTKGTIPILPMGSELITRPAAENVFAIDGSCNGRVFVLIAEERTMSEPGWKRIASPNFSSRDGAPYLPFDLCFWKVVSPDESNSLEIRIELMDMNTGTSGCDRAGRAPLSSTPAKPSQGDVLTVFNGPDETAPILGYFCGEHKDSRSAGTRFMTSANQAFVKFSSGPATPQKKPAGFLVAYRSVSKSGWQTPASVMTASSTASPLPLMPWQSSTKATPAPLPLMPWVSSTVPTPAPLPLQTIVEGQTRVTSSLSRFGSGGVFSGLESTTRHSAKISENAGSVNLARCEGRLQILSQDAGSISSPNHGSRSGYLPSDSCLWEIIGRSGTRVQLIFKEFDVGAAPYPRLSTKQPERCPSDRVIIFDGPGEYYPVLGAFCGTVDSDFKMTTNSNAAFVQFTSMASGVDSHSGFMLEYKIVTATAFGEEGAPPDAVHHSHMIYAEAPMPGKLLQATPLLSDAVAAVKPLPQPQPAAPWWWCDDDLVAMLPDNAITGSSEQGLFAPKLVRDRRNWSPSAADMPCCWQPKDDDANPFIQFDFGGPHIIGSARILDMRPPLGNSAHQPLLYLLVTETFENAESRIPLTSSEMRINIKPPIVASKVRVYLVRQRTVDGKLVQPPSEQHRPLIRMSLFGCASSTLSPSA